ncbi:hypothetical protein M7775_18125 [Sporomusa sphaeroides DSM 2875]|uniref:hypothetical protein n=1 Tax=Sporomusa sphaeroides TaxID=47679 RepID=UPI00202E21B0|nr:hypothetical protein [Sporomusa sphaeroides]MCM0760474.1 hypothetical protein [Sporomusa sphaeroides DSM 2875]
MKIDEFLKNHQELMDFLRRVSTKDLEDAITMRRNVISVKQEGVHVITIAQQQEQKGPAA